MASALYADDPSVRLNAALRLPQRQRRAFVKQAEGWPPDSPGALNAWLLLVTTKPPTWRDPFVEWRDLPPTLGSPHEGFFYPDPLGFWGEIRHWATMLVGLPFAEALSVSAVLHGDDQLTWALSVTQARVVLFLDEPAWQGSKLTVSPEPYSIADPFRAGKTYDGWWGRVPQAILGKAPQHPAAHKLYDRVDMDGFLRAARLTPPAQTART